MTQEALLARVDDKFCLDFLARMVQHKSYTQTEGEKALAGFMVQEMRARGVPMKESIEGAPNTKLRQTATESVRIPVTVRGVKLYIDGALGSRGAALIEPYSDDPNNLGLLVSTGTHLEEVARVRI